MKPFDTDLRLETYLELGNKLKADDVLMCIDHYPCKFISVRKKNYKYDNEEKPVKVNLYKIEFLTDWLYAKGKIAEVPVGELKIKLQVKDYESYTFVEKKKKTKKKIA